MDIREIAEAIDEKASAYQMGNFQEIRKKRKGLKRVRRTIFSNETIFSDENEQYAFHHGGRKEIQFNIGFEEDNGLNMFRHGLAFSLKPGRALHKGDIINIFQGKINRFNDLRVPCLT